jgi:hypothetical protein
MINTSFHLWIVNTANPQILCASDLTPHDKKLTRDANGMLTEGDAFCFHNPGEVSRENH